MRTIPFDNVLFEKGLIPERTEIYRHTAFVPPTFSFLFWNEYGETVIASTSISSAMVSHFWHDREARNEELVAYNVRTSMQNVINAYTRCWKEQTYHEKDRQQARNRIQGPEFLPMRPFWPFRLFNKTTEQTTRKNGLLLTLVSTGSQVSHRDTINDGEIERRFQKYILPIVERYSSQTKSCSWPLSTKRNLLGCCITVKAQADGLKRDHLL
jgi:hypothetical protein